MDEDMVLVENCHTETADPSSMRKCLAEEKAKGEQERNALAEKARLQAQREQEAIAKRRAAAGAGASRTFSSDARTHSFDYTIDEKEDETSSSKEVDHTREEVKADDQCASSCVKKTNKSHSHTDPRPALPHRRKSIHTEKSGYERPGIEEIRCSRFRSMSPALGSPPPPPSPPFLAPPPPPPFSVQPFMDLHHSYTPPPPPLPLPPLPPPPPPLPSYGWPQSPPSFEVVTAEQLIPIHSAEISAHHTTSPIVGIIPFRRKVLLMRHQAHAADYQEYEWLLRFAETETWYEKPNRLQSLGVVGHLERGSNSSNKVMPVTHPKPMCLELPKVWASAALTTSLDNANTVVDQRRSKALKSRPLVYCLVLSTYESFAGSITLEKGYGVPVYKVIRCGSREAAVTEAFFAAGVQGFNVAFACVMRLDEDFTGPFGKAKKVEQLSDLALENHSREDVRVFY